MTCQIPAKDRLGLQRAAKPFGSYFLSSWRADSTRLTAFHLGVLIVGQCKFFVVLTFECPVILGTKK